MKQIIYLGGKKARNYTAPHEETDVIGDCDWKEGEVKTEGVDYRIEPKHTYWNEVRAKNVTVPAAIYPFPIPKKQEGEEELWKAAEAEFIEQADIANYDISVITDTPYFRWLKRNFTITRKS